MSTLQNKKNEENYKIFGLVILFLFVIIVLFGLWGYFISTYVDSSLSQTKNTISYNLGYNFGKFLGFFIKSGMAFGTIIAAIASIEKRSSLGLVLLHSILGWVYVIYYALTRKTVFNND